MGAERDPFTASRLFITGDRRISYSGSVTMTTQFFERFPGSQLESYGTR